MAIAHGDKVAAILAKTQGCHLGAYLVGGHFQIRLPVEHINNHVVLRANRYQVLARRRECLSNESVFNYIVRESRYIREYICIPRR